MDVEVLRCRSCLWYSHRWLDVTRTLKSDPSRSNRITVCVSCFEEDQRGSGWTWVVHRMSPTAKPECEYVEAGDGT